MLSIDPRPAVSLSQALRQGTASDHRNAERSGIVRDLLKGTATLSGYRLYLRNLYEVYETLEACLRDTPGLAARLGTSKLYRASSIASDLDHLFEDDWKIMLPRLSGAAHYCNRIEALGQRRAEPLVLAHAYVRYLGDLSGGQLLARQLADDLGLDEPQLSFYRFDQIREPEGAKRRFRDALDDFGASVDDLEPIVREAQRAFRHNVALSREVKSKEAA